MLSQTVEGLIRLVVKQQPPGVASFLFGQKPAVNTNLSFGHGVGLEGLTLLLILGQQLSAESVVKHNAAGSLVDLGLHLGGADHNFVIVLVHLKRHMLLKGFRHDDKAVLQREGRLTRSLYSDDFIGHDLQAHPMRGGGSGMSHCHIHRIAGLDITGRTCVKRADKQHTRDDE